MCTMHTVDATAVTSVLAIPRAAAINQHPPARKTPMPHRRIRVALHLALSIKVGTGLSELNPDSLRERIPRRGPLPKTLANGFLMKSPQATLLVLAILVSGSGLAQQAPLTAVDQPSPSGNAAVQDDTPAQQSISAAQQQIQTDPKKVQAYNELALAFMTKNSRDRRPQVFEGCRRCSRSRSETGSDRLSAAKNSGGPHVGPS